MRSHKYHYHKWLPSRVVFHHWYPAWKQKQMGESYSKWNIVALQWNPFNVDTLGTQIAQNMSEENAVWLKLPQFWATEPQRWFAQAEAQFALWGIVSDNTKYYYILSALDQTTASRLKDFISHPPAEDKYVALKDWLLDTSNSASPSMHPCCFTFGH